MPSASLPRLNLLFPWSDLRLRRWPKRSGGEELSQWANANDFSVVTTDADFVVIHLEQCDFPLVVIEDLLRRNAVRITQFGKDNAGILSLRLRPGSATR